MGGLVLGIDVSTTANRTVLVAVGRSPIPECPLVVPRPFRSELELCTATEDPFVDLAKRGRAMRSRTRIRTNQPLTVDVWHACWPYIDAHPADCGLS